MIDWNREVRSSSDGLGQSTSKDSGTEQPHTSRLHPSVNIATLEDPANDPLDPFVSRDKSTSDRRSLENAKGHVITSDPPKDVPTMVDAATFSSPPIFMDADALKQTLHGCLGNAVGEVERSIQRSVASHHNYIQQLVGQANAMAGKRLRPILVLLSAQAAQSRGRITYDQARRNLIHIATAAELVHMASLVHDDVMDQAETRRHQTTIYRSAGEHAALLLGDYLFTKGYATASNCGSTFPARKLASAATQLCEGELRQQASAKNWDLSVREYLSIIGQKTASLCAVSCRLGAWQVGSPIVVQRSLNRFGNLLGLAFQVFDDWLDYWGNDQTGKTLGTDLAQLKPTLPLLKFLQTSSAASKQHLLDLITSSDVDQQAEAYELIRQSDAGEKTLFTAQSLVQRAVAELHTLPDSQARSCLQAIAYFSIGRRS